MVAQPIRVSFVITGLHVGGAEMMLWKLLAAINRRRVEPSVIVLTDEGDLGERIRDLAVPLTAIGLRRNRFSLDGLLRLRKALKAQRSEIVQGWMYHANLAATVACATLRGRTPVLWNIRMTPTDLGSQKYLTALTIWLGGKLSWSPAKIVNNSLASALDHEKLGYRRDKHVIIPNGFDLNVFKPSPASRRQLRRDLGLHDETILIGMIGRYDPMKDHTNFLSSAAMLLRLSPGAHFVLAGAGVDEQNEQLTKHLARLGIGRHVHLLGPRNDIPSLMAALDVFALSSARDEGFPNVVGEAMACGVPCVVTAVGECAHIVGDTGKVVAVRNAAALADALHALLELGPQERKVLGERARQRVAEHFALDAVALRYENLYHEVLDRAHANGHG